MTTIRSAPPPMIPPRPASDARAAFFKSVSGPAPAASQAAPQTPPQAAAAPPVLRQAPAAMPERPLRPGSIIDIKV